MGKVVKKCPETGHFLFTMKVIFSIDTPDPDRCLALSQKWLWSGFVGFRARSIPKRIEPGAQWFD